MRTAFSAPLAEAASTGRIFPDARIIIKAVPPVSFSLAGPHVFRSQSGSVRPRTPETIPMAVYSVTMELPP